MADLATVQLRSYRSQPQSGNLSRKAWAGNGREYARVGFAVNCACVPPIDSEKALIPLHQTMIEGRD